MGHQGMVDMTSDSNAVLKPARLAGQRVAFAGKLGGLTKREGTAVVRQHGGVPVESSGDAADLLVIGADSLLLDEENLLNETTRRAVSEGRLTILSETEFWERLGLMEEGAAARKLYTPAMLAELVRVPLATIRRWHRRGLIVPVREVHRLPYFDFQEVATARQLASILAAGVSPATLEKKLAALSRFVKGVDRSLRQLAVIVEGRQILLRQGEGLVEPSGQLRFDFDALEQAVAVAAPSEMGESTISFPQTLSQQPTVANPIDILQAAGAYEENGQLELAVEMYRAALAAGGLQAEVCFQLAELLYRLGDTSGARERYYMAIELDEDFVEARSSLGCLLAETGELDLAVAAFQGALVHHPHYADVHYHLARTLGELGQDPAARNHWQTFLQLAPDSPWAEEARMWLNLTPAACATE
jgi:tetratricopeptide (TPR) repeat protein